MHTDQATCDICQEHFASMEELLEHQHHVHSADVARRRPPVPGAVKEKEKEKEEDTAA